MTLKRRLDRVEKVVGPTDVQFPTLIVCYGKDNPTPGFALIFHSPLSVQRIEPESDETYDEFSARVGKIKALGREISREEFIAETEGDK